jgi:hypothetical protein
MLIRSRSLAAPDQFTWLVAACDRTLLEKVGDAFDPDHRPLENDGLLVDIAAQERVARLSAGLAVSWLVGSRTTSTRDHPSNAAAFLIRGGIPGSNRDLAPFFIRPRPMSTNVIFPRPYEAYGHGQCSNTVNN